MEVEVENQRCEICAASVVEQERLEAEAIAAPEEEVDDKKTDKKVLPQPESGDQGNLEEDTFLPGIEPNEGQPRKIQTNKLIGIILVLAVSLGGLFLVSSGSSIDSEPPLSTESAGEPTVGGEEVEPEPQLEPLDLTDSYTESQLRDLATSVCKPLEVLILSDLSLKTYTSYMSGLKGVKDSFQAKEFVAANTWTKNRFLEKYSDGITGLLIETLSEGTTWDSSKFEVDEASSTESFSPIAIDQCNLKLLFEDTMSSIQDLQQEVDRVTALALSAPWYPKGFEEVPLNSSFAFSVSSNAKCSSLAESCAIFRIVSKTNCTELAIDVEFYDKNGRAVDLSVAYVKSVKADEPKLVNLSSLEKSDKFVIVELSCD